MYLTRKKYAPQRTNKCLIKLVLLEAKQTDVEIFKC